MAFGAGFAALVDFIDEDFIDFIDPLALVVVLAAAFGAGDAAIATPVVRNAAATSDARILFMSSPPFVATGNCRRPGSRTSSVCVLYKRSNAAGSSRTAARYLSFTIRHLSDCAFSSALLTFTDEGARNH